MKYYPPSETILRRNDLLRRVDDINISDQERTSAIQELESMGEIIQSDSALALNTQQYVEQKVKTMAEKQERLKDRVAAAVPAARQALAGAVPDVKERLGVVMVLLAEFRAEKKAQQKGTTE